MKVKLLRRAFGIIATAATVANKATMNMIDVNAIFTMIDVLVQVNGNNVPTGLKPHRLHFSSSSLFSPHAR